MHTQTPEAAGLWPCQLRPAAPARSAGGMIHAKKERTHVAGLHRSSHGRLCRTSLPVAVRQTHPVSNGPGVRKASLRLRRLLGRDLGGELRSRHGRTRWQLEQTRLQPVEEAQHIIGRDNVRIFRVHVAQVDGMARLAAVEAALLRDGDPVVEAERIDHRAASAPLRPWPSWIRATASLAS